MTTVPTGRPVTISEPQHRLLASIRDHDGDVWEGWRIWCAHRSLHGHRVNPGGAESAFSAIMRKGLAEHVGSNTYRLTDAGRAALAAAEQGPTR